MVVDTLPCGTTETQSIAPDRSYVLYRPTRACTSTAQDTLPLVLALHCLGCSSKTLLFWTELAEEYHFLLAIPEGKYNSFNAKACCGKAQERNVDDVGFLEQLIQDVVKQHSQQSIQVSPDVVYAVGWSNGAYMATYAAHLFRAIAPISGFQVDPIQAPLSHPVGLFQHHAVDDSFVRIGGCCSNNASMPPCCCGLGQLSPQCTSVQDHFGYWKSVNCADASSSVATTDITTVHHLTSPDSSSSSITCWSATGCQANTTLCRHSTGGHFNRPSLQRAFPMMDAIADFFARDACMLQQGTWSSELRKCVCANTQQTATYCWALDSQQKLEKSAFSQQQSPSWSISGPVFLCVAGVVCSLFVVLRRRRIQQRQTYDPVSTIEMLTAPSRRIITSPPRRLS